MNFETIKLDKGLYRTGKGFLTELEKIDPSENYKGTSLEGLDAFERQLKRFDIKVKGANSDSIEKFFKTTDSAVLFPEYVSRAVHQGVTEANTVDSLVASKTIVNSLDYRTISSVPTNDDLILKEVTEGSAIPETTIKLQDSLVKLRKRGRMLVASYEAIRFQRLDIFTLMLRQMGNHIAYSQFLDAVDVIIQGDDSNDGAESIAVATPGTLTYMDLVSLWNSFSPFNMNTLVVSANLIPTILSLPEFRDSNAGLNFHGTGSMITPFGANIIKTNELDKSIIALDKNYALEMVTTGNIQTEYDKLIDRQLERATITQTAGFAKIFNDASKILEV